MKSLVKNLFTATFLTLACFSPGALAQERKPPERKALTQPEQEAFLSQRTSGGIIGTFDSYCSLLFAINDVAIHTESQDINQTKLTSPFPNFYRPTFREIFDTVARQSTSSWKYDATRDYWVFGIPPAPLPFEITVATNWTSKDKGLWIGYKPSIAPVGMDVYMFGHYTPTDQTDAAALFKQVRDAIAVRFARGFKKDITAQEMSEVDVGKLRGLHFQGEGPNGIIWRQWVLVESGMAFAIVSAIKPEHEKEILPDVLKMVASFRVLDIPKDKPAPANAISPGDSKTNSSKTNR